MAQVWLAGFNCELRITNYKLRITNYELSFVARQTGYLFGESSLPARQAARRLLFFEGEGKEETMTVVMTNGAGGVIGVIHDVPAGTCRDVDAQVKARLRLRESGVELSAEDARARGVTVWTDAEVLSLFGEVK